MAATAYSRCAGVLTLEREKAAMQGSWLLTLERGEHLYGRVLLNQAALLKHFGECSRTLRLGY